MKYQNPLGSIDRETAEIRVNHDVAKKIGEKFAQLYHQSCVTATHPTTYHPVIDPFMPRIGPWIQNEAGVMLDFVGDVATRIMGNHHPEIDKMINEALEFGIADFKGAGTDFYYQSGAKIPVTQDFAKQIVEVTEELFPSKKYKVFFVNTGAEATCNAVKMACYKKYLDLKRRLSEEDFKAMFAQLGIAPDDYLPEIYSDYPFFGMAFYGAFHGRTLGMLTHTKSKVYHKEGFPTVRWVRHAPYNDAKFDYASMIDKTPLETLIKEKRLAEVIYHQKKIPCDLFAYTIIEPVQGEGGYVIPEKSFLQKIYDITTASGGLFISDEVQAGMGRTGKFWAIANFGIEPDLISTAKALHVGATIARKDVAEKITPGKISTTWGGGELLRIIQGYAIVKAIREYRDPALNGRSVLENAVTQGEYFRKGLVAIQEKHPDKITGVRNLGLMVAMTASSKDTAGCIEERCFEKGLIVLGCGKQSIRLLPPLDVRKREIDIALKIIAEAVSS